MPSCTVTVRAAGTPSATSICRIASDAQMKQSTWRYFQRDIAPLRRWKSTRREATSGGLASCVLIDSASPAIATPCGSWAWTMSGLSCLSRRDRRQAALRSISVLRRQRDEVEPFLRALPQLAARMRDEHRPMAERRAGPAR